MIVFYNRANLYGGVSCTAIPQAKARRIVQIDAKVSDPGSGGRLNLSDTCGSLFERQLHD
jgi:hypothetical protein